MEEDIFNDSGSPPAKKILVTRLEKAVSIAEERLNYESAHNPELLKALGIVKTFLKQKGRVCYGGTAMNMILPPKKRFYDPETDLPDYDFFTPDMEKDISILVHNLQRAGFEDVMHRVGIHEGTKKILVNFIPIADISSLSPEVYSVFHKRAIVKGGVRYTDPDVLRMMMYLELSRPKGMVSRWEKVYERLLLINTTFPPKLGRNRGTHRVKRYATTGMHRETFLTFCINYQRILIMNGLGDFYKGVLGNRITEYDTQEGDGIIGFLSPSAKADSLDIKAILGDNVSLLLHKSKGEIVPEYIEVKLGGKPVLLIFQEVACHSFVNFPTKDGRVIAIASPDTLITLYSSFAIFTRGVRNQIPKLERQIAELIQGVEKNRSAHTPAIPAFSLNCRGYQKGFSTLLREKFIRIQKEKEKEKTVQI